MGDVGIGEHDHTEPPDATGPVGDEQVLTPAQSDVLDLLGAAPAERPSFDPQLRHLVLDALEDALTEVADSLGEDRLVVSKHALSSVLGCEARHVAEDAEPFAWNAAIARGVVAHRAIELGVSWPGEPSPAQLVEEAVARLIEEDIGVGDWLRVASDAELATVTGLATDRVTVFAETFPPLQRRWRPVTESRVRVELAGGRIVLAGKVDLALGRATGSVAGKVLVDVKTGGRRPSHLDDLRFYALLEAVKVGTPPRLLATHYLDEGLVVPEEVTVELLQAALARTVEGTTRLAELRSASRAPRLLASPGCRWCPVLDGCETGRRWVEEDDER